jgi:tetratricopeptide (TPR) repeat protein
VGQVPTSPESSPGDPRPAAGTSDSRPVTPWDETVRTPARTPPPKGAAEPAVPDEAVYAPVSARFGKFIRTRRLGAGGMGEVWKAWDSVLGRWVALKFLKGGDDEEIARFRREAQTAGRLHHPNIAAIFEVDEDQGRHYIAMQFVEGSTLLAFPRDDRKLLARLVADAARAVQYAHEQGIVHRDLKPENVMVAARTKAGGAVEHHVYVMDFGLARVAEGASNFSVSGLVVGTPSYMPPEQARGERVGPRADVYALGATLYELLTELKPFEGPNVYETLRAVQERDPVAPRRIDPRIPADLETVVLKCLSKEPEGRYGSAQEVADDLQAFLAGESIRAKPESISRKIARKVRRHPVAVAAAALVAAGLAVGGLLASGGARDRAIAAVTRELEARCRRDAWDAASLAEARSIAARLEPLDPRVAAAARERVERALSESARAAIRAGDLGKARAMIGLVADAEALRRELREREAVWTPIFTLEAPFGELDAVFPKGAVKAEGPALSGGGATRVASPAHAEIRAEFAGAWRDAAELGLTLNGDRDGGYRALLSAPEKLAIGSAPSLVLSLRRREAVLAERAVPASEVAGTGTLRLLLRREGDLLAAQVNDREPLEASDPFALAVRGNFGLVWPPGALVVRLSASRKELPALPGPLPQGDELYVQGRFDDARARYQEAAAAAPPGELRREALYKQGLCELQSKREPEARALFGQAAGSFAEEKPSRWSFLADCQLLLLHFRSKDGLEEAQAVLEKLPQYRMSATDLARLLPADVRRQMVEGTVVGSTGANLQRRPEEHVARAEFALRAAELFDPRARTEEWRYHGLLRAHMMAGQDEKALRLAEQIFQRFRFGGDALEDYCWILRLRGDLDGALRAADRGVAADPERRVERARVRIARGDWAGAREDLEAYFKAPESYYTYSAACLLDGFVREQAGEPAAKVQEAWRRGLLKNWNPPEKAPKGFEIYTAGRTPGGTPLLHHWILASLTGDLSDAEAEQLLAGLMAFAGKENPMFLRLMRPSVLRATWTTPRGRSEARRIALRSLPFPEFALHPLYLGWIAFLHEVCFPPEPLSKAQDELLWRLSGDVQEAYREGILNERYFLPFGLIAQGKPDTPGMGWKEVAGALEKLPRVRGAIAYAFGHRYRKKGEGAAAKRFFEDALRDAGGDPLLDGLARAALGE